MPIIMWNYRKKYDIKIDQASTCPLDLGIDLLSSHYLPASQPASLKQQAVSHLSILADINISIRIKH